MINHWRAGCLETCTSGSEGGGWKSAARQLASRLPYRVVVWGRQAEVAGEHRHEGSRVFVEGKLRTRSWQDDSGQTRYMTELHAETVEFLDGRRTAAVPERDEAVEP